MADDPVRVKAEGVENYRYYTVDPGFELVQSSLEGATTVAKRGNSEDLRDYSGRTEMWATVWDSFLEAPLRGHGYFVSSSSGELFVWNIWANWTAHNMVLQALVSTGIIGAAVLLLGIALPVFRLIRRPIVGPDVAPVTWLRLKAGGRGRVEPRRP